MVVAGSNLTVANTATLNISGVTWNDVTLNVSGTITFLSDLVVSGLLSLGDTTGTTTLNGFTIRVLGDLVHPVTSGTTTGTAVISIEGTGTWSCPGLTTGGIRNSLVINTPGTLTISGTVAWRERTLTYIAGAVITTGSTLVISDNSTTTVLACAGISWNNVSITGTSSNTVTLAEDLNLNGLLKLGTASFTTTINGAFNINAGGSFQHGGTTSIIAGTATLRMVGTGSILGPSSSGALRLNTHINTTGVITIGPANPFRFNTGTLTYTAGTVITTGSTLWITNFTTLDVAGITWDDVLITSSVATSSTLLGDLNIGGDLSMAAAGSSVAININGPGAINVSGSFSHLGATTNIGGTAQLNLIGTGSLLGPTSSGALGLNTTINTIGTYTIDPARSFRFNAGTLTYTAGTVITTGSTLTVRTFDTILDVSGITWDNFDSQSGSLVITLLSNLVCQTALLGSTAGTITFNGAAFIVRSVFDQRKQDCIIAGTSIIRFEDNVTLSTLLGLTTGLVKNPIEFIGPGKTFTITGQVRFTGTVTLIDSVTFDGVAGMDVDTLLATQPGKTIILPAGVTHRVRAALTLQGEAGNLSVIQSDLNGVKAGFVLDVGATQDVAYVNATDIDSTGGQTVINVQGRHTDTLNWTSYTTLEIDPASVIIDPGQCTVQVPSRNLTLLPQEIEIDPGAMRLTYYTFGPISLNSELTPSVSLEGVLEPAVKLSAALE
jgi:hypothetical protein